MDQLGLDPTQHNFLHPAVRKVETVVCRNVYQDGAVPGALPVSTDPTSASKEVDADVAVGTGSFPGCPQQLLQQRRWIEGGTGASPGCRSIAASEFSTRMPYSRIEAGILRSSNASRPDFSYLRTVRSLVCRRIFFTVIRSLSPLTMSLLAPPCLKL